MLYALLLDRAGISAENGFTEPDGTVRLYFTLNEVKEKLHKSRQVATRAFHELKQSGLIVRRKQGLGRPAIITLNIPQEESK
ncbi:replication initiator protein A [Bacteroides heparinolyticus]|uniref:replication initiator protein A n=1 Tax=Prevotella heparinolytica TaxID=28113 RepID=UPI0035A10646